MRLMTRAALALSAAALVAVFVGSVPAQADPPGIPYGCGALTSQTYGWSYCSGGPGHHQVKVECTYVIRGNEFTNYIYGDRVGSYSASFGYCPAGWYASSATVLLST